MYHCINMPVEAGLEFQDDAYNVPFICYARSYSTRFKKLGIMHVWHHVNQQHHTDSNQASAFNGIISHKGMAQQSSSIAVHC